MTSNFRLGDWLIHPELNDIVCDSRTVHLEPKVMQVLVVLATRPGQVLSKEGVFGGICG